MYCFCTVFKITIDTMVSFTCVLQSIPTFLDSWWHFVKDSSDQILAMRELKLLLAMCWSAMLWRAARSHKCKTNVSIAITPAASVTFYLKEIIILSNTGINITPKLRPKGSKLRVIILINNIFCITQSFNCLKILIIIIIAASLWQPDSNILWFVNIRALLQYLLHLEGRHDCERHNKHMRTQAWDRHRHRRVWRGANIKASADPDNRHSLARYSAGCVFKACQEKN